MSYLAYPSPTPSSNDVTLPVEVRSELRQRYDALFDSNSDNDSDDDNEPAPEPKAWTRAEEDRLAKNGPKGYDGTLVPMKVWTDEALWNEILQSPPIPRDGDPEI